MADGKLDLNAAEAAEIAALPDFDADLADRLVAYRDRNGPFRTWEQVAVVPGLGAGRLKVLRRYADLGDAGQVGRPRA